MSTPTKRSPHAATVPRNPVGRAPHPATLQKKPAPPKRPGHAPHAATVHLKSGTLQLAKYVPPNKRAGYVAPPPAPVQLTHQQARPLYDWLDSGAALSFDRIVNQVGDYVTLRLTQTPVIGGAARYILFNVHQYFGHAPYLGGIWAEGVYHCAMNAQENPRGQTCLQMWLGLLAQGNNPSLHYDDEDDEWDLFFDADSA